MHTQKEKVKSNQIKIGVLLIIAVILYYYGHDICHELHNQYLYPEGDKRDKVARQFWDLRFSLYSVIIAIAFYTNRFKLNPINKSIAKIGFNLAFISAVDKLIFKSYDISKVDIYIFAILVIWEIYQNIKLRRNELHKNISRKE